MNTHLNPADAMIYTRLSARALADPRFRDTRGLREIVLAMLYLFHVQDNTATTWEEACALLRLDRYDVRRALAADVPRHEPRPTEKMCAGININGSPCRTLPSAGDPERDTDPVTGEWRQILFCRRHHKQRSAHVRAERQGRPYPAPMPNRGGLLSCYLRFTEESLLGAYRSVAGASWEPPPQGMVADLWEGTETAPERKKRHLRLVSGNV